MSRWRRPDAGQRAAFEAFVQHRGQALAVLARGLTSSSADAEDLLQEGLATVLERWERVSAADDPYLYARRVLVNAATSTWRRRHREHHTRSAEHVALDEGEHHLLWRGGTRTTDVVVLEERMATVELLRRLPQRQRAVVVLRYLEDLPDAQVAELLGISAVTVRSSAMRALRTLREVTAVGDREQAGSSAPATGLTASES